MSSARKSRSADDSVCETPTDACIARKCPQHKNFVRMDCTECGEKQVLGDPLTSICDECWDTTAEKVIKMTTPSKRKIQTLAKQEEEAKKEEGEKSVRLRECSICGFTRAASFDALKRCTSCASTAQKEAEEEEKARPTCKRCGAGDMGFIRADLNAEGLCYACAEEEEEDDGWDGSYCGMCKKKMIAGKCVCDKGSRENPLVDDEAEEAGSSEDEEESESPSSEDEEEESDDEEEPPRKKKKSRAQIKWEQGDHTTQGEMEKYALVVTNETMQRIFLAAPDRPEDKEHVHLSRLNSALAPGKSRYDQLRRLAEMLDDYPDASEVCDAHTDFKGDLLVTIFRI